MVVYMWTRLDASLLRSPVYGGPALGSNTFAHLCEQTNCIHHEKLSPASCINTQALAELGMHVCGMRRYSSETGNLTGTFLQSIVRFHIVKTKITILP